MSSFPSLRRLLIAALAATLALPVSFAARPPAGTSSARSTTARTSGPAKLAAEVAAIANSSSLSRAKKEKRISTAVRVAVVVATSYKTDADEILSIALDYASAAGKAAPAYAEVISSAISFAPAVSRVDAAAGQIRTAAFAAANTPRGRAARRAPEALAADDAAAMPDEAPAPRTRRTARPAASAARPTADDDTADTEVPATRSRRQVARAAAPAESDDTMADAAPVPSTRRSVRRAESEGDAMADAELANSPPKTRRRSTALPPADEAPEMLPDAQLPPDAPVNYTAPRISIGDNANVVFSLDLNVRHDDNVYLGPSNEVGDTIYSATPGLALSFGQKSLAHGSLAGSEAFTRYAHDTSPNVNLGSIVGDFGYDNGSTAVGAAVSFHQLDENSSTVAAAAADTIYRRDETRAHVGVESHLTGRTSVGIAGELSNTHYRTAGLVSSRTLSVPFNIYYETTPKVSLSTGVTYEKVSPQGDNSGPSGNNLYYNVGLRGNLTPKLTANVSTGYRVLEVVDNPREHLWGFDGTLNYEMTEKSSLSFVASRNFNPGPHGESLKDSHYDLKFLTDPSAQWEFVAGVSYHTVEFGPTVFANSLGTGNLFRSDRYWQGDLVASYLFSSWLSFSLDYTRRNNNSNFSAAEFSDNIISLTIGLRY